MQSLLRHHDNHMPGDRNSCHTKPYQVHQVTWLLSQRFPDVSRRLCSTPNAVLKWLCLFSEPLSFPAASVQGPETLHLTQPLIGSREEGSLSTPGISALTTRDPQGETLHMLMWEISEFPLLPVFTMTARVMLSIVLVSRHHGPWSVP